VERTVSLTVKTFKEQQRKTTWAYHFQRKTDWATDGVPLVGSVILQNQMD